MRIFLFLNVYFLISAYNGHSQNYSIRSSEDNTYSLFVNIYYLQFLREESYNNGWYISRLSNYLANLNSGRLVKVSGIVENSCMNVSFNKGSFIKFCFG